MHSKPGSSRHGGHHDDLRETVLVLDVDNTLYNEQDVRSCTTGTSNEQPVLGIEEQIVQNIHKYCQEHAQMDKGEADQLHFEHGTTIEGLRRTSWNQFGNKKVEEKMKHCYETIYDKLDYSGLLRLYQPTSSGASHLNTGYSHQQASQDMAQLRELLENLDCPLYLASNSPSWHVRNVVQALGLLNVPWSGLVTPDDSRGSITASNHKRPGSNKDNSNKYRLYPTKHSPSMFYQDILHRNDNVMSSHSNVVLLDDSKGNIDILPPQLMSGIRVTKDNPIVPAILQAMGMVALPQSEEDTNYMGDGDANSLYEFSQIKYLKAKNVVDAIAIHQPTWNTLATNLRKLLRSNPEKELQIVDVGAGLLSMLKLILEGNEEHLIPSLVYLLLEDSVDDKVLFKRIKYYAYEPNRELQSQCIRILEDMGFTQHYEVSDKDSKGDDKGDEHVFVSSVRGRKVVVHLRLFDYNEEVELPSKPNPHLIVGCCFADLMDPYQLVPSLLHRFLSKPLSSAEAVGRKQVRQDCLCYFPITFQGVTQFIPPRPFQIQETKSIPSDTVAFALYSRALEKLHGHNLNPQLLIQAMKAYGATEIASGQADWDISAKEHPYLWETMLYFFERVAAPELLKNGWDAKGWLRRARGRLGVDSLAITGGKATRMSKKQKTNIIKHRPSILVSNVDLLFRMPRLGCGKISDVDSKEKAAEKALEDREVGIEEIQFTAPYKVATVRKRGAELGPNQVQIKSECSLISSGTELKIFKGMFDEAALDVNIKGMDEERMAYPLAYGYSLVGRVVQCGSGVADADNLLGRLVFAFAAHASHVVADRDCIHLVPDGIEARDAIFMPSVETALSIVHDAHVRVGERVAVFGQGLIGLLITAILCCSMLQNMELRAPCYGSLGMKMGSVTTIDAIPSRLAASASMGSSQALLPSEVSSSGPFDVAIEVSGNARALQSAIDNTSNHGRLIIGSWYGNADVALKLGIDFHRSHKTLITSQVSEIKAELSGLWTKDRRFGLTWGLVRQIRPSRLLTMRTKLRNAQEAYESLDKGSEIAVAFDYLPDND